jgi:hypothetical protein
LNTLSLLVVAQEDFQGQMSTQQAVVLVLVDMQQAH